MSSPPGDEPGDHQRVEGRKAQPGRENELRCLAPKLISLEVWCRQRGLDDITEYLSAAVDIIDKELTDRD